MRRQVPGDVDVFLKEAQIEPARRDVLHFANITRIDDLFHAPHGRRKQERVPHHQHQPLALRQLY